MSNKPGSVPIYGLYGETLENNYPGFVHVENIADRSNNLGWVIKEHRHSSLYQIICLFDGQASASIDGKEHELKGNSAVLIPAGTTHGFRFQPYTEGFVLTIECTVLTGSEFDQNGDLNQMLQVAQFIDFKPSDPHFSQFLKYVEAIRNEYTQFDLKRNEALVWLSKLSLLSLTRQLWQTRLFNEAGTVDTQHLTRFWTLLEAHFREHWPISQYAEHMNMSTSSLGRLCYEYMGESPKNIVQKRIMGEAKKRLLYTRQTIEEIAFSLGFKDQAYFSRIFKKSEGLTPGAYRKKIN